MRKIGIQKKRIATQNMNEIIQNYYFAIIFSNKEPINFYVKLFQPVSIIQPLHYFVEFLTVRKEQISNFP